MSDDANPYEGIADCASQWASEYRTTPLTVESLWGLFTTISPELTAFLEELDAMRAITKTRKYPGSESHIAVAKAIDRARCARLALEAIRKTDYDEARAVFTAAKTTTVSSRQAYDVAVDAYSESRDAGTKTAAASMRKAYLLAIIAQETAYRAVCNARSVMVDNGTD